MAPRQLVRHKISFLRRERNIRSDLGPEPDARALWRSYKNQPLHPIVMTPDGVIVDGNRRHWGAELEGDLNHEVECAVLEGTPTAERIARAQLTSAVHRADISAYDKAVTLRDLKGSGTNKQIADEIHLDPAQVTRILSLWDCVPEIIEAARLGQIGISDWYAISKASNQPEALRDKLCGASREELQRHSKSRNTPSSTVKASAIRLPLGNDVQFSIKGPSLSLDAALDYAAQAIETMKAARNDGHTAKTITAWLANKPAKKPRKVVEP